MNTASKTSNTMSEHLREGHRGSLLPELRLILLGNIGCGKTSSGDTILSQLSPVSPSAARSCQLRQGVSEGRKVTLVEAPRWYWSGGKMEDSVRKETERAMTLVAPGPHAILLLVPVNQFTEMEGLVPAELEKVFGAEVLDHTLVLLTCGDYLMGKTVEEYLQKEHPGLRQIIERCGGTYDVINNRQRQDRAQVRVLLEKVDNMVQKHGVFYMKTTQERDLENRVKERKQELMETFRAQKEERRESLASTCERNTETQRKVEREEQYSVALESRRNKERDEMEGSVGASQVSDGLHSTPAPEQQSHSQPHEDRQVKRTPSFRLNEDGAILSQMSESKASPKMVTTFHHRINSFEQRSPEASPTSSPHSPVFSSSPSVPAFASSPSTPSSSSSPSSSELRLVLLGRSGAGKSTAGNRILGQEGFESRPDSLIAVTQECGKKKALVAGRKVAVVDTPDWFNSERTPDEVRAQISSCVALSSPGPHAFLLCVPIDQPAKTELQALTSLKVVFGPEAVQRHTLVLFTHSDRLRESGKAGNNSVEAYIAGQRKDLLKLVEKCGDRFHVLEMEGGEKDRKNVAELLEKVEQTVREADGQCYSCPAFQEAENRVRQRQVEITRERRKKLEEEIQGEVRQLSNEQQTLYPYMQPVAEAEEEVREDEIEKTRDEAEMSVSTMNIESLPPFTLSSMSPSLLHSMREKMESTAKMLPKLLGDSSVWAGEGAKKVKSSPIWGAVGSGAQNVQKMLVDSSVWEKVGTRAGHVSKLVGDRVPKVVVDSSAWIGSGAKAAAASPMWKKVGSGAKSGAILVADSSVRLGAGIGAGAKTVAQSPVWGKVGSGAKAGAKMVAESSVWEKLGTTAKKVPKVVIGAALLGLVLGVYLWGVIGGAVGAAAGSAVSEVGRRKFSNKHTLENTDEAAKHVERTVNDSMDSLAKQGEKVLKTE
ncbi:uncharacterized protein LOC128368086 [Scomber scombrus]|uniref:Uncharacterized protein LOC128368086 n=1 Tax=Scomber scombrus TaxID=13677 RepID=A0AAV1N2H6_SCOSC